MLEKYLIMAGLACGFGAIGGIIGSGLWLLWERMRK
jgi:hypothetical protein